MLPLTLRLSLILKSCLSNSNSAMEFFFIKSMMALISFKSTIRFQLDFRRVVRPTTLENIQTPAWFPRVNLGVTVIGHPNTVKE
jgi:hypothetical protein